MKEDKYNTVWVFASQAEVKSNNNEKIWQAKNCVKMVSECISWDKPIRKWKLQEAVEILSDIPGRSSWKLALLNTYMLVREIV